MKPFWICFGLIATYAITSQTAFGQDEAHTWADVEGRLKDRTAALPAIKVKCLETTFQAAGVGFDNMGHQKKRDGTYVQGDDLRLVTNVDLLLDKTRWRWEIRGPVWEGMFDGVVQRDRVNVFDGQRRWAYDLVEGEPSAERRAGWITTRDGAHHWMQMPQLVAWMALYHPFDPGYGLIDADRWRPEGELERVRSADDDSILVHQRFKAVSGPPATRELFFDPEQNFALRKFVRGRIRVEIEYREYPSQGWFPSTYKTTQLNANETAVEIEATTEVKTLDIVSSIDDGMFEMQFPPGVVVRDTSKGTDAVRDAVKIYYVKNDGSKRQISQGYVDIDYSALSEEDDTQAPSVTTEPESHGSAASTVTNASNPNDASSWLLPVILIVLVAVVLVLVARGSTRGK